MPNPVALSGALPGEPTNGLFPAARDLMANPGKLRLIVGLVDVPTITQKRRKGYQYPTVEFRHIELVPDEHWEAAAALLGHCLGSRTGQLELPFLPGSEIPLDGQDSDEGEE